MRAQFLSVRMANVTLEFWPDYGDGPVWTPDGKVADLAGLGLSHDLIAALGAWNRRYAEDKIPLDGVGDAAWLAEGRLLLRRLREALKPDHAVVVTEDWWGEDLT